MTVLACLKLAAIGIAAASIVGNILAMRAAGRFRERWIAYGRRHGTERERRLYLTGRLSADVLARLEAPR